MHQHDTDDAAPILGEEITIQVAYQAAICATKSHDWELNTKHNMCNWIKHIMISGRRHTQSTMLLVCIC